MEKIKIIVFKDGKSSIDAIGFSGNDCIAATRVIEQAIGNLAGARKQKAEMAQSARKLTVRSQ